MKFKVVPAYRKESSMTVRLTPIDIGELLSKCSDNELERVLVEFRRLTGIFGTSERNELVNRLVPEQEFQVEQNLEWRRNNGD